MSIDWGAICCGSGIIFFVLFLILYASLCKSRQINDSIALRGRIEEQVRRDYPDGVADIRANHTKL